MESSGTLGPLIVKRFDETMTKAWDDFVTNHPKATFFHLLGWKRVLEKTFGFEPCYLVSERNGQLTGIAPFFWMSSWVTGKCLISLPLAAYAGVCAEDPASEAALLSEVRRLAVAEQAQFLELRNRDGGLLPGFRANPLYVTFRLPLCSDPAAALKRFPKDTRYMIRKSEKLGLRSESGTTSLAAFYQLLARNYHKLGTPIFPYELFQNLVEEFPKQTHLLMTYAESRPITGVLSFFFRDTILPYYAGATEDAPKFAANNFMYWELMKWSAAQGFSFFDFGRSKVGTGSYAFKTQWNPESQPLDYQVLLVKRKTEPNFSPLNPKFAMATRVWKKLPFWLTTQLGPRVVRWFP